MIDEDDDTPRIRIEEESMSRDFVGQDAQPYRLAQQVDELERRLDLQGQDVVSLIASRKTFQRILLLIVPFVLGGIVSTLVYAADKISASSERVGETAAEMRALKDRIVNLEAAFNRLQEQVWNMRKQSKSDSGPPTSLDLLRPDKYSALDQGAGGAGGVSEHRPKLQTLQPCCGKIWHSGWLEQMSPHTFGRIVSWISWAMSSDSRSGYNAGESAGSGDTQDVMAKTANAAMLRMPML